MEDRAAEAHGERQTHGGVGGWGERRGGSWTGREATGTNINQLEKQEEQPGLKASQAGLVFPDERPRRSWGWGVETSPDSSLERGLHLPEPGCC